jgi:methylated-DNA-[protein]-cysteine S-methyltransferase
MYRIYHNSPVGLLEITANNNAVTGLYFADTEGKRDEENTGPVLNECVKQLTEYFSGKRKVFEIKVNPAGTPFQKSVWNELLKIPFGETVSYGEIAERIGNPKSVRAVGLANGSNPVSIIIPCHRVIGKSGSLVGYGGGIENKRFLLELERKHSNTGLFSKNNFSWGKIFNRRVTQSYAELRTFAN